MILLCHLLLFAISTTRAFGQVTSLDTTASTSADVIIIGAGMAGVTAARELQNRGISSIVLEARDRVGGRIYSINTTYGPVDAGAMWIHDSKQGNPLYEFAIGAGEPMSRLVDYVSVTVFNTSGSELPKEAYVQGYLAMGDFRDEIAALQNAHKLDPLIPDVPLYDVYQNYLKTSGLPESSVPMSNLQVNGNYQVLLNGNLTKLSTLRFGTKTLPALDVFLLNGYDRLVKIQTPGLDIRLNTPVKSVKQTDSGVTVTTADGRELTGAFALSTESLGCLKTNSILYDPPLPVEKQIAIGRMGMGIFDKAIMVFDQSYWNTTDLILQTMNELSGLWKVYLNYDAVMERPILMAFNVANTARAIETMTDEEIKLSVMSALRGLYPDIPDPVEFYATRWFEDPWSRGSYSYFAVGNEKDITEQIGRPFERVYFAGEATSAYPGTVLGAYTSGKDRAEAISKRLQ